MDYMNRLNRNKGKMKPKDITLKKYGIEWKEDKQKYEDDKMIKKKFEKSIRLFILFFNMKIR